MMGVYQIKNMFDDKVYIGSSVNISQRISVHKSVLRRGSHQNQYLQRAWTKHGESAFCFTIVEVVDLATMLIEREQFHINRFPDNYNLCSFAGRTTGYKHSPQTKLKIGAASKLRKREKMSDEAKVKMSLAKKGKPGRKLYFWEVEAARRRMTGEVHPMSKLTFNDVDEIREHLHKGELLQREIAGLFQVSVSTVSMIKNRQSWKPR